MLDYAAQMKVVHTVQRCRRASDGPVVIQVPSHSEARKMYECLIPDRTNLREVICECEGYQFRGYCRHQREAVEQLCTWIEPTDSSGLTQTDEQFRAMLCPVCGDQTEWVTYVTEEPDE